MLSSPSTPLRLSIGACSLSSTTKLPWANEDAQFVAGNYCGVFDGVSALPASRAYARRLSSLTRSTLSRLAPDAAAWKGTAVSALQAAARGANSLDGASTAALACVDLERRQLSTYVLGDSGWLLFAPSASGRRLCARSSPQPHRVGTPACPYGNAGVAISSPGCSPKGVGRCSCIAAWDTQVRRSSSGQSCVAVARPSRAPPSEAPPAGRGGLARFTCGWPQSGRGQSRRLWPAQVPAGGRAQGRAIRSTLLRPRIDPACAVGLRAPPVRPSLPPRSFDPSFEPLAHRSPNPTPHPPQTRRCAPPVRPLAPLPPRLAPIYGVARRWRVRQRMCTQHRHTDGLLGNLALDEIAGLVERDAARGPRALARRLASAARARRLRPDDVTVVAVLLDERGSTVDASSVAAWGAMGLLGLAAASALQLGAW